MHGTRQHHEPQLVSVTRLLGRFPSSAAYIQASECRLAFDSQPDEPHAGWLATVPICALRRSVYQPACRHVVNNSNSQLRISECLVQAEQRSICKAESHQGPKQCCKESFASTAWNHAFERHNGRLQRLGIWLCVLFHIRKPDLDHFCFTNNRWPCGQTPPW